jgi:hypothetical protein
MRKTITKPFSPPKPPLPKDINVYTIPGNYYMINEYNWTSRPYIAQEINCKFLPPDCLDKKFNLYVGGSTFIDVERMLTEILYQEYDLVVFKSPKINCIYKDALITSKIYWDISESIAQQMRNYRAAGYHENRGLLETDIILRAKTDVIKLMNNIWLEETNKYKGSPDVYGFNYAVFKSNPKLLILSDNYRVLK